MGFPKVVACCADTAVIVRDADFPLAAIIPSPAKKYIIRHPAMVLFLSGSKWHRVVEVGTGITHQLPNPFSH
ncbi:MULTISPECIES: hypothetical protein [Bacteroides]|jgi:hypothetical protein|uniref:hypothetical protein n=1 Tax=Bacteroides TaxID=816 RepID=UPI001EE50BD0|nr:MULTISPECIES: hypothetical protein [Bacteroides]